MVETLKFNAKKRIGTVVFVVEGENDEFEILERIFNGILNYRIVEEKRCSGGADGYVKFVSEGSAGEIVIMNTSSSSIKTLFNDDGHRDRMYRILRDDCGVNTNNASIYYIWDRDKGNNRTGAVRKAMEKYFNAQGNEESPDDVYENGLVLLSYPCCQAYTISNFERDKESVEGDIKQYVRTEGFLVDDINEDTLIMAAEEMKKAVASLGVTFDLSNMKEVNLGTLDWEEKYFTDNGRVYRLLSFISVALLELGIIA